MDATKTKARDLMRTAVTTLSPDDTIEAALTLFEDQGIGGAPVVANGRLVGMLTLTDVTRTEHLVNDRPSTRSEYALSEPVGEELTDELDPTEAFYLKDDYSPDVRGRALIGDWMSRGVVSVAPEDSLQQVCSVMANHKIHRVCVTSGERLVGLITSFDVVRHMAGRRRAPTARPPESRRPRASRARS